MDDGGGVVDVLLGVDEADDEGDAGAALDDDVEGVLVVADELGPQEEVFRRVAGDRQLGEGDEVDALGAGPLHAVEDLGDVAFEVADGDVDLGEADT